MTTIIHRRRGGGKTKDRSAHGSAIRAVFQTNGDIRRVYELDLASRERVRDLGIEGPDLPTAAELQGFPGLYAAGCIASRVAALPESPYQGVQLEASSALASLAKITE